MVSNIKPLVSGHHHQNCCQNHHQSHRYDQKSLNPLSWEHWFESTVAFSPRFETTTNECCRRSCKTSNPSALVVMEYRALSWFKSLWIPQLELDRRASKYFWRRLDRAWRCFCYIVLLTRFHRFQPLQSTVYLLIFAWAKRLIKSWTSLLDYFLDLYFQCPSYIELGLSQTKRMSYPPC